MLAGIQAAQMCRSDDDMPNDLFPNNKRVGTVSPIIGPATYHGQGCRINSRNVMLDANYECITYWFDFSFLLDWFANWTDRKASRNQWVGEKVTTSSVSVITGLPSATHSFILPA
jgi:hypothetical protein